VATFPLHSSERINESGISALGRVYRLFRDDDRSHCHLTAEFLVLRRTFLVAFVVGILGSTALSAKDDVATVKIADHTFHVPIAYGIGSPDATYLRILAKLPCLKPLTRRDLDAFYGSKHDGFGQTVLISVNPFSDNPYRVGRTLLDFEMEQSRKSLESFRAAHPDSPEANTNLGPWPMPDGFRGYQDFLLNLDVFVTGQDDWLVVNCNQYGTGLHYVPRPACTVSEQALDTLHLWYVYDRRQVDNDIANALTIDTRVKRLLASFELPNPIKPEEICK
jgi:hypothetical protein